MALRKIRSVAVVATLFVGGCTTADKAMFPSLAPVNAGGEAAKTAPVATPAETSGVAPAPAAAEPTAGEPTGTFVGQKVVSLRGDLQKLQATVTTQNEELAQIREQTARDSQGYHGIVAAIEARLQLGTTPGNPVLLQQWNDAQAAMDATNEDVQKMTRLATQVASTSGIAAYLVDSVRAARDLSGAVDEDHRQLRLLEDETNGTTVLIERLLTELSTDVQRQQQYLANERSNLNNLALAIKSGQYLGVSLGGGRTGAGAGAAAPAAGVAGLERPLVVIRFDRAHVPYEDALYTAVKGALDRRPNAIFEVIGVAPVAATPGATALGETSARRNAETVMRSLAQMGLPADRVRVSSSSSPDASNTEVRVFVR